MAKVSRMTDALKRRQTYEEVIDYIEIIRIKLIPRPYGKNIKKHIWIESVRCGRCATNGTTKEREK